MITQQTINALRCRRTSASGFTLVEIMVVVLIIAILASLIIPKVINNTDTAKVAAAKSDIASLSSALDAFRLDNGRYPTTDEGLQALEVRPSNCPNWKGPYLTKQIPMDPWGNPYQYQTPGPNPGDDYLISSNGAGGQGGNTSITSDDTQ